MNSTLAAPPQAPTPGALDPNALRLGYAGLLPFVLGAFLVWVVRDPEAHVFVAGALSAYAALIIGFLGGIHWGLAFRHPVPPRRLLLWGVVPSLVAWPAVLMPAWSGLVIHGAMLLVCYAVDRRFYAEEGVAHWLTLRFRLSAVASLSCFIGAAGS